MGHTYIVGSTSLVVLTPEPLDICLNSKPVLVLLLNPTQTHHSNQQH